MSRISIVRRANNKQTHAIAIVSALLTVAGGIALAAPAGRPAERRLYREGQ